MPLKLPDGDGYILAPVIEPDAEDQSQIQWQEYWHGYSDDEIAQRRTALGDKAILMREFGYHDVRMKTFRSYYVRIPSLDEVFVYTGKEILAILARDEVYETSEAAQQNRRHVLIKHHSVDVANKMETLLLDRMRYSKADPKLAANKNLQNLVAKDSGAKLDTGPGLLNMLGLNKPTQIQALDPEVLKDEEDEPAEHQAQRASGKAPVAKPKRTKRRHLARLKKEDHDEADGDVAFMVAGGMLAGQDLNVLVEEQRAKRREDEEEEQKEEDAGDDEDY